MKLWIPALLLLSIFVGATLWQSRWTSELRDERRAAWDRVDRASAERLAAQEGDGSGTRRSSTSEREWTPRPSPARPGADPRRGSDRARILVGRPSGARPIPRPAPPEEPKAQFLQRPARDPIAEDEAPRGGLGLPAAAFTEIEPDFTMVVRNGQSLSVICQEHYGTARKSLVDALAAYNGLPNADSIRVGDSLSLPAIERLESH